MDIKTAKEFISNPNHKPNFQVTSTTGETYWISRSCAICAIVVCHEKKSNKWYILANKRGEGTPDWQGYWNIPCGYVDWGETCNQACAREIWEECGIRINPESFELFGVMSDPEDSPKQNITIRHIAEVPEWTMHENLTDTNSEKDEVDSIRWIPFDEVRNYEWAFNHANLLDEIFHKLERRVFVI